MRVCFTPLLGVERSRATTPSARPFQAGAREQDSVPAGTAARGRDCARGPACPFLQQCLGPSPLCTPSIHLALRARVHASILVFPTRLTSFCTAVTTCAAWAVISAITACSTANTPLSVHDGLNYTTSGYPSFLPFLRLLPQPNNASIATLEDPRARAGYGRINYGAHGAVD
ncbi:hypothetical protein B0H13DRAFT_78275 [Mycena leptocephala]|nr:hypothetical protein B0H13DRAFT_78275 [Mycena leptocephala]